MALSDHKGLMKKAREVEQQCYFPEGKEIDGSPYTAAPAILDELDFVNTSIEIFGGIDQIRGEIATLAQTNPEADPRCANWLLWMILHKYGVARENLEKSLQK